MAIETGSPLYGILLSGDLLFASQAAGVFAQRGAQLHEAADVAGLIKLCREYSIRLAIVDLTSPSLDAVELVAQIRSALDEPPLLFAYGPHVRVELLAAARTAGFDQVFTRGQLHGQLGEILSQYKVSG